MKVAFFLGSLTHGGAESLVYDICRKWEDTPFDCCCLYRNEGGFTEAFKATGVEMIQVQRTGSIFLYLWALRRAILANHIDIVHTQTASNALVSILSLLFTRVKIVVSFHGFSFSDAPRWYRRIVYGGCRQIICVSEFEKRFYESKWELSEDNKFRVIYNGIDFSKLDHPGPDSSKPLLLNHESLNMIMVGSFIEGRSQFFICRVLDRLHQMGLPFNMYFVGRRDAADPGRFDACVSFCEQYGLMDAVHFLGNRTDVPYLLGQMDLFLYASEHDTFGIAVVEALACGLPVVVNDWVVMKEITQHGQWATLYKTDDVEDCVSKITGFMRIKNQRLARDLDLAHSVRAFFSIEKHIQSLFRVYEEALA